MPEELQGPERYCEGGCSWHVPQITTFGEGLDWELLTRAQGFNGGLQSVDIKEFNQKTEVICKRDIGRCRKRGISHHRGVRVAGCHCVLPVHV